MSAFVFTAARLRELADEADTWEGSFAVCLSAGQARTLADTLDAIAQERDAALTTGDAARGALDDVIAELLGSASALRAEAAKLLDPYVCMTARMAAFVRVAAALAEQIGGSTKGGAR